MRNNCSGQIIAPLLLLLIPAVVLVGLSLNSGRAVIKRIKLQTEADCIAASTASWIANGLNETALANREIKKLDSLSKVYSAGLKYFYEAEIRRLERVRADICLKIIEEANRELDEKSAGRISFPIDETGLLDTSLCRITICMVNGKEVAFAAKKIATKANEHGAAFVVSDFVPVWCKVEISSEDFDFMRNRFPAALEGWTMERLNGEMLH